MKYLFKKIIRAFLLVLISGTVACLPVRSLFSQSRQISHADYLRAVGIYEEALGLQQLLLEELRAHMPVWSPGQLEQNAAFFSFVLLLTGITPETARSLQNDGIDIIHAITSDIRPLGEQSLLSDLVILGDVVSVRESTTPGDGFDYSVVVKIRELLKGEEPGDTVVIRQRSVWSTSAGRRKSFKV